MWKVKGDVAITREKAEYILEQQPLTAKDWTNSRMISLIRPSSMARSRKPMGVQERRLGEEKDDG